MHTLSPATVETALRFALKDDDGRLYAPITPDHARPYVYLPGRNIHAAGEEIHLVNYYAGSDTLEVLAGNGYTLEEGPLIALLRSAIHAA